MTPAAVLSRDVMDSLELELEGIAEASAEGVSLLDYCAGGTGEFRGSLGQLAIANVDNVLSNELRQRWDAIDPRQAEQLAWCYLGALALAKLSHDDDVVFAAIAAATAKDWPI